ncbi:glycoside hydrolase family 15 protein [Actinoplanes sp. NPDC051343]|uniref:glycoside hydrolase family 15 protein n=1 Tax=Actinoplanes sp. NPDC051343 TaxID=3363906 RepID=UPI0037880AC7
MRSGPWAPLGEYGVIGNGRTVALIAGDGRIDWWPLPALDAPPAFAALLDPERGGYVELAPRSPFTVKRRYLEDTNVLETTFRTASGEVRVTDALTVGRTGELPWTELVRRVDGASGEVDMAWTVRPGSRFETAQPWIEQREDALLAHCGDQHMAVLCFDVGEPRIGPYDISGEFRTGPGSRSTLAFAANDDGPVYLPRLRHLDEHLEATIAWWRAWARDLTYEGPWRAAVRRSALALKLLQYRPTGALAAAATTSLPERIGGDRNYDYRYMWVRDAAYTIDALLRLDLHQEVHAAVTFLLRCARATDPDLKVFYSLRGGTPDTQATLNAAGYRDSRPVRSGNAAAEQTQLGTFGDLFDSVWRYVQAGHVLDPASGRLLADLADRCCDLWRNEDAGLWELHVNRHYTISKMGCWVALDRAVRLHEAGQIPVTHPQRWREERDAVHDWVDRNCWSPDKQSYTFYAGSDDLDAATLLAGQIGFDRGDRLAGTVAAIRRELADGALVYRYTGMRKAEGAFLACSFWLVSALAALGRHDEATNQMTAAVGLATGLGLLTEEMDPATGEFLGNLPQALSHLALVNAAFALAPERSGGPAGKR